jgi:hypothetical protein
VGGVDELGDPAVLQVIGGHVGNEQFGGFGNVKLRTVACGFLEPLTRE